MKPEGSKRSLDELSDDDRRRLQGAHRRLREAVAAYERFRGGALPPNKDIAAHDFDEMAAAQAEVERAEDEIWRLREELLGWKRPSWAPKAVSTSEWFSDEDAVYDDLDPGERAPRAG